MPQPFLEVRVALERRDGTHVHRALRDRVASLILVVAPYIGVYPVWESFGRRFDLAVYLNLSADLGDPDLSACHEQPGYTEWNALVEIQSTAIGQIMMCTAAAGALA